MNHDKRRYPGGDYGLSATLFVLFALSWVGQAVAQYHEAHARAAEHGQSFQWGEYWPEFLAATFENWQSEYLQLFSFVVLATYLIHRGSPQSRDDDDELKAQLDRIERKLNQRGLP